MVMRARKIEKTLPNFFIVGAAKSGTTSLAYWLSQHPDIFIPPMKEPFYFVPDSAGIKDFNEYLSLFRDAGAHRAVGEASTGYLYDEHAARSIRELIPRARIIVLLRNPVNMVFSYWQYAQIAGNETLSFEEAISDEQRAYRRTVEFRNHAYNWWAHYLYLERALYYHQVKRYFDLFGRDQVRVFIFEEFLRDPAEGCRDVFRFLGVDASFVPDLSPKNEGGVLRSQWMNWIYTKNYPVLKRMVPPNLRAKIRILLLEANIKKGRKSDMHPDTRRRLQAFFREDIKNLEELLERPILSWRT